MRYTFEEDNQEDNDEQPQASAKEG